MDTINHSLFGEILKEMKKIIALPSSVELPWYFDQFRS